MSVGFIGLGRMGQGMARNLLKGGAELIVYDTNADAVKALAEAGAKTASSVADLASRSTLIFTSLPGPVQVEEVVLGPGGVLESLSPGTTLFDLSTSSRSLALRVYEAFKQKGSFMLDAPISGGPAGAATGELALWIGGDRTIYDQHLATLKTFSNAPIYVGEVGAGSVTKLAHNVLGYIMQFAQAEVFSMATKAGMDPLVLWEALRFGVVGKQSPLEMLVKQFLPGKYETPSMALKLGHKDVTLATNLGKELGVPMKLSNMTLDEMTEALGRGYGEWDARAFLQLQLERAGVEIAVDPDRLQAAIARVKAL